MRINHAAFVPHDTPGGRYKVPSEAEARWHAVGAHPIPPEGPAQPPAAQVGLEPPHRRER